MYMFANISVCLAITRVVNKKIWDIYTPARNVTASPDEVLQ